MQVDTVKLIRDATLSAMAIGLSVSKAMPNLFCTVVGYVAGGALAVTAALRAPAVFNEMRGFKKAVVKKVGGYL